jgi:DNA-binding CsgD family transcriptional regulator
MRTAAQGNFSATDTKLLRQLHPRFVIALQRLHTLERERVVRVDLEEFVRRLPLPTILVRWNLKLLFQNRAARDFCSVWESGFEQARLLKLSASIPMEILEVCRRLKQRWRHAKKDRESTFNFAPIEVRHPQSPYLKATIRLKQLNDAVAQPHFLIECTDSQRLAEPSTPRARLPQLARLTNREQEVTRLVCNGQSNQEIADEACLSVPTVKKHLHAVFRKLEVTSRSQLMALML